MGLCSSLIFHPIPSPPRRTSNCVDGQSGARQRSRMQSLRDSSFSNPEVRRKIIRFPLIIFQTSLPTTSLSVMRTTCHYCFILLCIRRAHLFACTCTSLSTSPASCAGPQRILKPDNACEVSRMFRDVLYVPTPGK